MYPNLAISWAKVISICLLCFGVLPKGNTQPYAFRSYSLAEGLPQSQAWCGLSDNRGYLWFGTQGGGLARYDGQQFESFTTVDGLSSNFIHCLYQEKDYRIWIGTNQGLNRYNGHQFEKISGIDTVVNSIIKMPDGRLLAASAKGLFVLHPDSSQVIQSLIGKKLGKLKVHCLKKRDDQYFAGTDRGLWQIYPEVKQLTRPLPIFDIAIKGDSLCLAAYGSGVYVYTDTLKALGLRGDLTRPMTLFFTKEEKLAVGTQDRGMLFFDPAANLKWSRPQGQAFAQNNVRDIIEDQQGRLWLCTSGGGVACRTRQNFLHYDRGDGLAGESIYAIHRDTAKRLWLAVSRKGIQVKDSTGFSTIDLPFAFRNIKCKTICSDSLNQIWVGTDRRGIAVLDTAGWYRISVRNGLPADWVLKLVCDREGNIWGATYTNGIFKIQREGHRDYKVIKYGLKEGLPDLRIGALALDQKGLLWFGTADGKLGCIQDKGVFPVFGPKEGLPSTTLRSLAFDKYGQVWIGSKGKGIYWADLKAALPKFTSLSSIQQVRSENIYLMLADKGTNIWAGSENGVEQIKLDSQGQILKIRHFNKNDGFLGIETCHDAALSVENENIWFGTMNGLTRFAPGENTITCSTPIIHFTSVDLFYKPLSESSKAAFALEEGGIKPGLVLTHRENHLSFSFKAVSQLRPEDLKYRWKLMGANEEWSPASKANAVNYANLPPGRYRFMAQAAIGTCSWSTPVEASFLIEQPFWQEQWFTPTVIGIALILMIFFTWYITRSIKLREKRRREKLEVQNHLLQLEQKALQLQMNPHFIFNALTGIQSLVAEGKDEKARWRINEFAKLMRNTLNNSRKANISLNEELEALKQYLEIEKFTQAQSFDYTIKLDEHIDLDAIIIPPMLLQPFLENAVVHGISHLAYPGSISLDLKLDQDLLLISIQDNGVGRKKAEALQKEKKPGHQSIALKVNQERLLALRGQGDYQALKISDVINKEGKIAGTKVEIIIPVDYLY